MLFVILLFGLVGLWLGTEFTIRGAVVIAEKLGLPEFIVGVAILSLGSDLPELAIAIQAGLHNLQGAKVSDVVIGSALGSALSQIGFVLGFTALLGYLTIPKKIVLQHGSILLGSLVLLALFAWDGRITRIEGVSLITIYCIYFVFLFTGNSGSKNLGEKDESSLSLLRSIVYLGIGLFLIILSASLTVSSVTQLASLFGLEQSLIAILIVGFGTSLPELSISFGAILKGKTRLSVGNLLGSNIFDTLIPIGVAASIAELDFSASLLKIELPVLFLLTLLVLAFFIRKKGIQKYEAIALLVFYCIYVLLKLVNT